MFLPRLVLVGKMWHCPNAWRSWINNNNAGILSGPVNLCFLFSPSHKGYVASSRVPCNNSKEPCFVVLFFFPPFCVFVYYFCCWLLFLVEREDWVCIRVFFLKENLWMKHYISTRLSSSNNNSGHNAYNEGTSYWLEGDICCSCRFAKGFYIRFLLSVHICSTSLFC